MPPEETAPEQPTPTPETATPPAAAAELVRKTPDEWALLKWPHPDPQKTGEVRDQEKHLLAGAKVHNHWVMGDQLTEAQFDAGWAAFRDLPWG